MNNPASLGIDCGELEYHVTLMTAGDGTAVSLPHEPGPSGIICDRLAPNSLVGVGFPSVMRLLGTNRKIEIGNAGMVADTLFERRFGQTSVTVASSAGGMNLPVVIAVPAMMSDARRRALIAAARRGGLNQVRLVDRAMAAAAGFVDREAERKTLLVAIAGYSGAELALIRGNRGRYRTLGSLAIEGFGNQSFQQHIIEDTVLKLRDRGIFLGLKSMGIYQWLAFREQVVLDWDNFTIGKDMTVTLPTAVTKLDTPVETSHAFRDFHAWLQPQCDALVESANGLLEESGVAASDVDTLLLAGEDHGLPFIGRLLTESLHVSAARGQSNLMAFGAALLAQRADSQETPGDAATGAPSAAPSMTKVSSERAVAEVHAANASTGSGGQSALLDRAPASSSTGPGGASSPSEDQWTLFTIRQRWANGDHEIAYSLLQTLIFSAQQTYEAWSRHLAAPARLEKVGTEAGQSAQSANFYLDLAQKELRHGDAQSAVAYSHQAWALDSSDHKIFTGMMDIHVRAAAKADRPEDYAWAIHTLQCAHQHDQTNREVHKALAGRHVAHAKVMLEKRNLSAAQDCLKQALRHEPKDSAALQLMAEISG